MVSSGSALNKKWRTNRGGRWLPAFRRIKSCSRQACSWLPSYGMLSTSAGRCRKSFAVNRTVLLRSEEHTSELQSLMRISYAVFCLKKKKTKNNNTREIPKQHTLKCDINHTYRNQYYTTE